MKIHVGFAIYIYARAVNSKWDWQHLKTLTITNHFKTKFKAEETY